MFYKVHKFKEGGTLLWAYDPSVDAVDVTINITTGSQADTIPGITHFLEHMLMGGSVNKTKDELWDEMLHGTFNQNAYTSFDNVCLSFTPTTRDLEASMEHNGEMFVNSTFPEDKIEREKGPVIAEIRMYEDAEVSLRNELNNNLFRYCFDFGYGGSVNILGTEESVKSITRQDLLDYRNRYFNRGNLIICMYGNVSYEKAKELCKKYVVEKLPEKGEMFIPKTLDAKLQPRSNLIHQYVRTKSAYIQICFPYAGKQNYKSALLSQMINKVVSNKLSEVLRLENSLIYSPFVFDYQFSNDGLKVMEVQVPSEKTNETLRLVAKIVGDLVKEGVSQEEFLNIKQNYLDGGKFGRSNYIFGKTSKMYQSYLNNDRIYSDREKQNIFQFITCEDLNNQLKMIFDTQNAIINFMGDRYQEEMYNPQQIQALFLLNRFSEEELLKYGYKVPDMSCPGEFVVSDNKNPWGFRNEQVLLEQFDDNKVRQIAKKVKEYNQKYFPKTKHAFYDELTDKQRKEILNYIKENNIVISEDELKEQTYIVENNASPKNLIINDLKKRKNIKKISRVKYEDLSPYRKEMVKATLAYYGIDLDALASQVNSLTLEEIAKSLNISVEQLQAQIEAFESAYKTLQDQQNNKEQEKTADK